MTDFYHPDTGQRVKLWRVDVERRLESYVYVLAETAEQAQEDAEEMSWNDYDFDSETDYYAHPVSLSGLPPARVAVLLKEEVWTGGPDGTIVTLSDIPIEPLADKPPAPVEIPGQLRIIDA